MVEPFVCSRCGVACVQNRHSRWFHIDGYPVDMPTHDPEPVALADYRRREQESQGFVTLRQAASDMLTHHVAGHPEGQCLFAQQLRETLSR